MKANYNKYCQILRSPEEDAAIQIEMSTIKCLRVKKLLGIHINYKLKFDTHVETICKNAHRKLNILSRITNYMKLLKSSILVDICSLNKKINRLYERCLRVIYNDKRFNFEELLNKNNSSSQHYDNIHALAIELHKVANDMSLEIMSAVFKLRDTTCYNLRHDSQF